MHCAITLTLCTTLEFRTEAGAVMAACVHHDAECECECVYGVWLCSCLLFRVVVEDAEFTTYTVTLFKRVEDEFRHKCREHRFTVRDFKFDDEAVSKERSDLQNLQVEQKRLYVRSISSLYNPLNSHSIHSALMPTWQTSVRVS